MTKMFAMILMFTTIGCAKTIEIHTVHSWEGHYYNEDDVKKAVECIQLDEDESVWLMSDSTLNAILKNIGRH